MPMDKSQLSVEELLLLSSEMRSREKSLALSYLMLIGGHLGIHRFYLKRPASGAFQLVLSCIAILFYIAYSFSEGWDEEHPVYALLAVALVFGIAVGIWMLVDLFLIPGMVKQLNDEEERAVIGQIVGLRNRNG